MAKKVLSGVFLFVSFCMGAQTVMKDYAVKIGNFHPYTPYGICIVVDDKCGLVIEPDYPEKYGATGYTKNDPAAAEPALTAPDYSYSEITFKHADANVTFTWGRSGENAVIASLETDKEIELNFKLTPGWPNFHLSYLDNEKGIGAWGLATDGDYIPFKIEGNPVPVVSDIQRHNETAMLTFQLKPGKASVFSAGTGELPAPDGISDSLKKAKERYFASQLASDGDWGNFAGAIFNNLNNSKLYSSDNKRIAHVIGRGWWIFHERNPDRSPYFVWDGFFSAAMTSLEDIEGARNTVRAIVAYTTPDGFVPSYSHWNAEIGFTTLDRSMPPVGSLCVWKMHQRMPDNSFLEEVYPKLLSWHDWWPTARDGNNNGLLEWGSNLEDFGYAMLETGWDDNVHYLECKMEGKTMNADAVDLNALWSMDAEYLAKIATALGKTKDAERLMAEKKRTNKLINSILWNNELGIYCSRLWDIPEYTEDKKLDSKKTFSEGFNATYYNGRNFEKQIGVCEHSEINFDWNKKSPFEGVDAGTWSASYVGKLAVPANAVYHLQVDADNSFRVYIDNELVIDQWDQYNFAKKYKDIDLKKDKTYEIKVEYSKAWNGNLHFNVYTVRKSIPQDEFLTRITGMNLYPLMSGAPDKRKAEKTLEWLYNEEKFWGDWIVPTVPLDDPVYQGQHYWRGNVWAPANYLIYEGVKRYATPEQKAAYIDKSVQLFMRNWNDKKECGENYNSIKGTCGAHPHYTWGALLPFLGVEYFADINDKFEPVAPAETIFKKDVILHNVPFGGKLYTIQSENGTVTVELNK